MSCRAILVCMNMHPFNTFPFLLSLSFFVPVLFRVSCTTVFILLAQRHVNEYKNINKLLVPLVGKLSEFIVQMFIAIEVIVALMLFAGWHTQIAGILATALSIKFLVVRPHSLSPFGKMVPSLLLIMSLSLIITGSGAFGLDIPL